MTMQTFIVLFLGYYLGPKLALATVALYIFEGVLGFPVFTGTPEKIENLFKFVATAVRQILSSLGFKSINEIIGRTDLLSQVNKGASNLDDLDLNPLLVQADPGENLRYCKDNHINKVPETLDEKIWTDIKDLSLIHI